LENKLPKQQTKEIIKKGKRVFIFMFIFRFGILSKFESFLVVDHGNEAKKRK